ncbi:MAG TPA: ATP-binding cassette domain-containing protein [bacterium]|nr:ATP-binding cassette domain-containing protein [bacterium]
MIQVEGISKNFGMVTAVSKVSFEIAKGEVVGFLGPNGAGKTTMMRILTGYMPADEGTAKVAGHDVFEESMRVRESLGYLPENAPLYLDMRVDGFLDYVASIRGIKGQKKADAIKKMIAVCGLGGVIKKQIGELSKGYKQRVGLAQAMIHNPDILVLDEPTSGLDPNQIREIRALMKELGREKTVILSTHILPEVEATCGRVIIIDKGRVVADGTIEAVTKKSRGGNVHVIMVRGDKDRIESGLKTIPDVVSFQAVGQEGSLWRYEIVGREGVHLGEQIFRMAADSGISLAELRREKTSLESVFQQMTEGEKE